MRAVLALVVVAVAASMPAAAATGVDPLEQTGALTVATFGSGSALALAVNGRTSLEGEAYAVVEGVQAGRDFFVLALDSHTVFEVVFPCALDPGPPKQAGMVPCDGDALIFMVVGAPGSAYYYLEA